MNRIAIEAKGDFLERLSNATPIKAIAELIWNGLDAGAGRVAVRLETNALGGIEAIRVTDDGFGINHAHVQPLFGGLGDSWKRQKARLNGRLLHGKTGQGRFKAFALGNHVEWRTVFDSLAGRRRYQVVGRAEALTDLEYSDPVDAGSDPTGTEVIVTGIQDSLGSLQRDTARVELAKVFAEYLSQYPGLHLEYEGQRVDPAELQLGRSDLALGEIPTSTGTAVAASLTIVEWPMRTERMLHLCDADGFSLHETDAGPNLRAPGFEFTAYLKSGLFRELEQAGNLALGELHPDVAAVVQLAREAVREHFRQRLNERQGRTVERWQEQGIYPFETAEAASPAGEALRQMFDVLAFQVEDALPAFEGADPRSRRLLFRLLAEALRQGPEAVQRILLETLHLKREEAETLAGLLGESPLPNILQTDSMLAGRLGVLASLEGLVLGGESSKKRSSRDQLHRILESAPWLFDEDFALAGEDPALDEALRGGASGEAAAGEESPASRKPGPAGRAELRFGRVFQAGPSRPAYLVVDVKRASQAITTRVLNQASAFATALAQDPRFSPGAAHWQFVLVGTSLDEAARTRATADPLRPGLVFEDAAQGVEIRAFDWSDLIGRQRMRLEAARSSLQGATARELAKGYLTAAHSKYIPKK